MFDRAIDDYGRPVLICARTGKVAFTGRFARPPTRQQIVRAVAHVEAAAAPHPAEAAAPLRPGVTVPPVAADAGRARPRERRDGGRRSSSGGDGGDSDPSEPEPDPAADVGLRTGPPAWLLELAEGGV
jgi:hypothetical protein